MGSLQLIGDSSPVNLKFKAVLSEDFVDEVIDETGVRPPGEFQVVFNLGAVESADHRRRLRLAHARYKKINFYPVLRRPADEPESFLALLEPWLDAMEKKEAESAAEEKTAAEEEAAAKSRFHEDMRRWVADHGSERLRLATQGGYRSNTSYALERSKLEMPEFWLDSANDSEWGERVDPSEEALLVERSVRTQLEKIDPSLSTRIVWLTRTPRALESKLDDEGLDFEPQEALVVEEYLGRYLLVMPLESELRRQPEDD